MIKNCTAEEAAKAVSAGGAAGGARLLDVREPAEFLAAHVPGSRLIPLSVLDTQLCCLDRGGTVYLLCGSGIRASQAAGRLEAAGFEEVRVIEGGILSWEKSGAPLHRQQPGVWSLERQVRGAAGLLVAAGVALAWAVHPGWALLSAFVGCGLMFSAVTGTCGMALVLKTLPWNK